MTTAAACARCSLERHALKPVNYDNTCLEPAWRPLPVRAQLQRRPVAPARRARLAAHNDAADKAPGAQWMGVAR